MFLLVGVAAVSSGPSWMPHSPSSLAPEAAPAACPGHTAALLLCCLSLRHFGVLAWALSKPEPTAASVWQSLKWSVSEEISAKFSNLHQRLLSEEVAFEVKLPHVP